MRPRSSIGRSGGFLSRLLGIESTLGLQIPGHCRLDGSAASIQYAQTPDGVGIDKSKDAWQCAQPTATTEGLVISSLAK